MSSISSSKTLRKDTLNVVLAPRNYMPQHPMLNSGLHAYHFQEAEPLPRTSKSGNVLQGNDNVWNMNSKTIYDNVRDIVENIPNIYPAYTISNVISYYESLIKDKYSSDKFGKCRLFALERKINDDWRQIPGREKSRISRTGVYIRQDRNARLR